MSKWKLKVVSIDKPDDILERSFTDKDGTKQVSLSQTFYLDTGDVYPEKFMVSLPRGASIHDAKSCGEYECNPWDFQTITKDKYGRQNIEVNTYSIFDSLQPVKTK